MEQRFETFTTQIAKISRSIKKIKSEEMAEFNLKTSHVSCIYYLYKSSTPLTAKELCDICDEDKGAISRAIEYLEINGYLTCNSKFEKRYKSPLNLTDKGIRVGKIIESKVQDILNIASKELTLDELKTFYKSLNIITCNLEKFCDQYGNKKI